MIFTTFWFVLFAAAVLAAYYAVRRPRARLVLLAAASVVFYAHFSGLGGVSVIGGLGIAAYLAGRSRDRRAIALAVTLSAGALVFYKYAVFGFDNLAAVFPAIGAFPTASWAPTIAPLAISFFVFEYVHYLIEVWRGHDPIESPLEFLLFAAFFPTLVAGPIKRYGEFLPALRRGVAEARLFSADTQAGLARVAVGLAKKFAADSLTIYINATSPQFADYPLGDRWLIFAAIAMRIYLDFSGYSDIAIGLARMMGVRIPENFNWPYLATNLREFWRRWHISLSTWIRDYIYVPLGGSRAGSAVRGLNLLSAFVICGLWHGAAWNFVLWGLFHGCGLVVHHGFVQWKARGAPAPLPRPVSATAALAGWALTTFFVWSGWLLFFHPPGQAWKMFTALFHA